MAGPADPIPSPLGASSWSGAHTRTIGSSAAEIDLRRLNKLIGRRAARPTTCAQQNNCRTSESLLEHSPNKNKVLEYCYPRTSCRKATL